MGKSYQPDPEAVTSLYIVCLTHHHTLISASRAVIMITFIRNDLSVVSCVSEEPPQNSVIHSQEPDTDGKTLYAFKSRRLTDGHALHPFVFANAPQPSMFSAYPEGPVCPWYRLYCVGTIEGVWLMP